MKKPGNIKKIAVIIGTITDDLRILEIPKMTVTICIYVFQMKMKVGSVSCDSCPLRLWFNP